MSHVRSQIRAAFKSVLDDGLPATYEVFASRKYRRNHTPGTALVDMRILNENIEQRTMGDERVRVASLYIRVQRSGDEDNLDDALDADETLLTSLIEANDWSLLLEEEPELVQVNFSEDAETDVAIGAIILRYDVEYRIDKTNPEIVKD